MGVVHFRVGGHVFATLASQANGFGNLMLTQDMQAQFVGDSPELYLPVAGGWGRMGITHIRLAAATEQELHGALRAAWSLRVQKNGTRKSRRPARSRTKQ